MSIAPGPIHDEQGRELWGCCDFTLREIRLSPVMPLSHREETLRHEYMHAWLAHVPSPYTEEDECNLFATASMAFDRQFVALGGEAELMKLEAVERLPHESRQA